MPGLARPAGRCLPFSCITPSAPYEDDPYDITVRPERFDQQMRWLRRAGRRGTSVRPASRRPSPRCRERPGRPLLRRRVRGFHRICPSGAAALRVRCHDVRARRAARWRQRLGSRGTAQGRCSRPASCVRWRRPESRSARMAFATCPCRPVPMRTWPGKSGRAGTSSREVTGHEVDGFCYPYGHLDERVIDGVGRAGYSYGCAVWDTEFAGRYALAREYIRDTDSPRSLWTRGARRWLKQEYRGPGSGALRGAARTGVRTAP